MRSQPRPSRRRVSSLVGLLVSTSLVAAGVVATATTAQAEPANPGFAPCPAAFPASELTPGLEAVGLTTAGVYRKDGALRDSSVTPETFSGEYQGTVEDSSGDIYVFDLQGSRITKSDGTVDAGGWSGISGSPLYAADGRLIGSVSYSFIEGTTNSVGVTPAADLYELRDRVTGGTPDMLRVSKAEQATLRKAGASAAVSGNAGTLKRILAPKVVGGVQAFDAPGSPGAAAFLAKIARRAGQPLTPLAVGGGSAAANGPTEIVAGGNVAFADSYGAIPFYSVGTAAAVCGDTVVAYGHPNNFSPATESMHSAVTTGIQSATGVGSFKLANLGPALGTQIADGLNGVLGRVGALPDATLVHTETTGARPRTSESTVPNPLALPTVVATQVSRDLILAVDSYAGGEATVAWTIHYVADGKTGSLSRSNRYSDQYDLPEFVANDVASDVETLQSQELADVKITRVDVTTNPKPTYRAYTFGAVKVKSLGKWRTLSDEDEITLPKGRYFKVRVRLEPASKKSAVTPTFTQVTIKAPSTASSTQLVVSGGFADYWFDDEDDEDYATELESLPPAIQTFAQLVAELRNQVRNDQVAVDFSVRKGRKVTTTTYKKSVGAVVEGGLGVDAYVR